ncbi:hypothetical protein ALO43_200593 [Pseudomonas tremae]|uniref:MFS transporter n=1 Tax=Pseudomonas tremae TaxID=200454 RepID=A0AA40P4Q5_9PSED|nr:hypothetical protein ALO43_200593 [Pseudomonas tremae]
MIGRERPEADLAKVWSQYLPGTQSRHFSSDGYRTFMLNTDVPRSGEGIYG